MSQNKKIKEKVIEYKYKCQTIHKQIWQNTNTNVPHRAHAAPHCLALRDLDCKTWKMSRSRCDISYIYSYIMIWCWIFDQNLNTSLTSCKWYSMVRPRSEMRTWPLLSSRMFSGLQSLNIWSLYMSCRTTPSLVILILVMIMERLRWSMAR